MGRAVEWLRRRGVWALVGSRFVPGTRVITCFAAGVVRVPPLTAVATIAGAALAWTPVIVGLSALATRWSLEFVPQHGALLAAGLVLVPWIGRRGVRAARGSRARRTLAGWHLRLRRWEFWPAWIVYVPVVLLVLPRALRARSLTVFTAANPGMPAGGFIGESKTDILRALASGGAPVAPFTDLAAASEASVRLRRARAFVAEHGLPVVLKPDTGQRGAGVRILRSEAAVRSAVLELHADAILQAYVGGLEFGVFYARRPGERVGHVVSVTAKHLPVVTGDGVRTLDRLIEDDPRAVAMAALYRSLNTARLDEVPAAGQQVTLSELGSHCRGAIFLDGARLLTPALEAAVERAARAMPGFCFGRFDVKADDAHALSEGRFSILELNGVTSEPTHVYDPSCSFAEGVRALARSWRLAFDIGAAHAAAGARVWSAREVVGLVLAQARSPHRPCGAAQGAAHGHGGCGARVHDVVAGRWLAMRPWRRVSG
jgi:hypothetical protein